MRGNDNRRDGIDQAAQRLALPADGTSPSRFDGIALTVVYSHFGGCIIPVIAWDAGLGSFVADICTT